MTDQAVLDVEALRRRLAAIEHRRWADWQRWMHEQCYRTRRGELVIPRPLVERWERQIATPFEELSEAERASDLEQVDRYWPLIEAALTELGELRRERRELRDRLTAIETAAVADAMRDFDAALAACEAEEAERV